MPRATEDHVRNILPSDSNLTTVQIVAAISAATCVVDQLESGLCSHLNQQCLLEIERYLAAHNAAVSENTLSLSAEKDGCSETSATYGFKFGEGIKGTPFGQTANTISGGALAEMDKQPVRMFSIGNIGA